MKGFDATQARIDYSAHFGPADGDGWWKDAACEELWDEEASAWAEREPDYIHEAIANTDLLARAARFAYAKPSDEVLRALGSDLLRAVRSACEAHETAINAMCIKRAEAYRREARDMMRGGE